jgi:hypothetical protein
MAEVNKATAGSQSAVNNKTITKNAFEKIGPKKIAAFTAAIMGIVKSGQASDLLMSGTKAIGFGLPFELLFPRELQAATLYTPADYEKFNEIMSDRMIDEKFKNIKPLNEDQKQQLLDQIAQERRNKEQNIDSGINTVEPGKLDKLLPFM